MLPEKVNLFQTALFEEMCLESEIRSPLLEGASGSVETDKFADGYGSDTPISKEFEQRNKLCEALVHAWKLILGKRAARMIWDADSLFLLLGRFDAKGRLPCSYNTGSHLPSQTTTY